MEFGVRNAVKCRHATSLTKAGLTDGYGAGATGAYPIRNAERPTSVTETRAADSWPIRALGWLQFGNVLGAVDYSWVEVSLCWVRLVNQPSTNRKA